MTAQTIHDGPCYRVVVDETGGATISRHSDGASVYLEAEADEVDDLVLALTSCPSEEGRDYYLDEGWGHIVER